jgi:hypothetical protein
MTWTEILKLAAPLVTYVVAYFVHRPKKPKE